MADQIDELFEKLLKEQKDEGERRQAEANNTTHFITASSEDAKHR